MYLIVIAWLYVTLMMGLVEAFSSQGTVLGAIITFVLYGLLPVGLMLWAPAMQDDTVLNLALEVEQTLQKQ